ncbi:glycosyl hydrolase family 8 [Sorangium sp. So ce1036]|uniref:glycosyl hydrolase family 8 n=1 Tax=Sorangium sp. So ce1036 TaxID=3133328 RepID=UPI003F064300
MNRYSLRFLSIGLLSALVACGDGSGPTPGSGGAGGEGGQSAQSGTGGAGSGGSPDGGGGGGDGGSDGDGGSTPGGTGAVDTGEYRNLFAEVGYAQEEISAKLSAAWDHFFKGDPDTEAVYFESGSNDNGPLAQIRDIASEDVRSEGMSYGMMIAVQLDHKAEFDALWNWAKTYMYHADDEHPAYGYFSWSMNFDGTPKDEMPAPDGEEYFATALYFASGRWGNGEGIYDYRKEADNLLDLMKNRPDVTGTIVSNGETRTTTGTTLFNTQNHQIRFTPDAGNFETNGDHTDPSYHLPAFYEIWAEHGPEADRAFWAEAAEVSRDYFQLTVHPETGLSPDYANFDGTPKAASWKPESVDFRFDAWRTAMNWSVDWAWWAKDPRAQELSDRIQAFFEGQGAGYANQFTLDGEPLSEDHSSGLVAMNAVASLSATHERKDDFVRALWEIDIPSGQYRYYDGMLYCMALLHVSGEFRAYAPR